MNYKKNDTRFEHALNLLTEGHVVGMPTETVYGLAADATNDKAVAQIYALKERPSFNPLIIHVDSIEMARQWGDFSPLALQLAEAFWMIGSLYQRPLTLVVKRNNRGLSHLVTAGLDTVAIRIPAHSVALSLITAFGKPLAAPSANRSNHISPTTADAVRQDLGDRVSLVLDGGACVVGLESTIVDVTTDCPILLRPGGATVEMIKSVSGCTVQCVTNTAHIVAPGMLKRHYAPHHPLRLNVTSPLPGDAFLGFGSTPEATMNLSESGDLTEAASNLFAMMRFLDQSSCKEIAVSPIPNIGIGMAINDRLTRAACMDLGSDIKSLE